MISAPIRLLKYTTIRLRIHSNQVTFLPTTSMTIRQLPVKSSPPTNTMIISPTGKMIPATNRARPTLSIACAAVLLVAPPSAMKAPAKQDHLAQRKMCLALSGLHVIINDFCRGIKMLFHIFPHFRTALICRTFSYSFTTYITRNLRREASFSPYVSDYIHFLSPFLSYHSLFL